MSSRSRVVRSCVASLALAACGAVPVHEPVRYRLASPAPTAVAAPTDRVVRVADVAVAAELDGDRMLVADGPVRVLAFRGHRFAAPIDRLVADALVAGLRRSGAFRAVRSALEPGDDDVALRVRLVDFHQVGRDGHWAAAVTLEVALCDALSRPLWTGEVTAATPLEATTPEALAVALSASLAQVVGEIAARSAGLAAPGR